MKELDSGLKIYDITELEELKDLKNGISNQEKQGYLYIIKYLASDGLDTIKIGISVEPYKRISYLIKVANNYGFSSVEKIAVSECHSNYYKSEKNMHKYYEDKRKEGCEIFNVSFDDACSMVDKLLSNRTDNNSSINNKITNFTIYERTELCEKIDLNNNLMFKISRDCTHVALLVYISILSHYNKKLGYSCVSFNDMANEINMGKNTICKHVKTLEKFGYIRITSGKTDIQRIQNSPNVYYLTDMEKGINT